jgi:phage gp29-like protein
MAILDQYGRPLKTAELKESQTARYAQLHREFANHPSRGLTPGRLANLLQRAEEGDLIGQHELMVDMEEKDAHVYAELQKRKMAVAGLDWNIEPPRKPSAAEKRQAEALEEMVRDIPDLEDVIYDLADGVGHGFACLEYEWQRLGSQWLPKAVTHRPQSWFTVDRETRSRLLLRGQSGYGDELRPFGWITHVHRSKSGYIARGGLFRVLAWPFLFKNYSVRDLAEVLEIYGLPARIGKYPPGASDKEKATLLRAVVEIGHNAAGIIPEGMAMEFMAAAAGASDPFEVMIAWCERSQSKAILGGTLTAEPGAVGSRSLGEVHNEVRVEIRDHDARQIASTLTRNLLYPLAALNLSGIDDPRRLPRFVFDTGQAEDLKAYADSLPKLVDYGARIPVAWVQDKLRIPEPEGEEPVLQSSKPAAATPPPTPGPTDASPPPTPAAASLFPKHTSGTSGCPVCAAASTATEPDALDGLRELALDGWQQQMKPLTHPLVQLLDEALQNGETIEEFRVRLPQLLEQMDVTPATEMLAQAAFMARAAGDAGAEV